MNDNAAKARSTWTDLIRRVAHAATPEQRHLALQQLVDRFQDEPELVTMVARLLNGDNEIQRIAVEFLHRLPTPYDASLVALLSAVVADRRRSLDLRMAIAARLLTVLPDNGPVAKRILQSLIADVKGAKALERLRELRRQVNGSELLDRMYAELEERSLTRCPRCRVKLSRPEMIKHLWAEHRLMLDGQTVCEPWHMVGRWLQDYTRTGDPDIYERSCEIAQQLDPNNGLIRVQRLLLSSGAKDAEVMHSLRREALKQNATVCPHCFAVVALPDEEQLRPLVLSHGRLAAYGYSVEVAYRSWCSRLTIDVPQGTIYDGPDLGRFWTQSRWKLTVLGPMIALALIVAWLLPGEFLPIVPVVGILLVASSVYFYLQRTIDLEREAQHRAINYAWTQLVPRLNTSPLELENARFLASLALGSVGRGRPLARELILSSTIRSLLPPTQEGRADPVFLAALCRLQIADATDSGRDPILVFDRLISAVFKEEIPIDVLEHLLSSILSAPWWSRGNQARLRVLMCAHAFETGIEVLDLHELGQVLPKFGRVIESENLDGLAHLRWLWELNPRHPWSKIGIATSVFELARYPPLGGEYLDIRPDLLLLQPRGELSGQPGDDAPILICKQGIYYKGAVISDPKDRPEILARSRRFGGGFELKFGPLKVTYREPPRVLAERLKAWLDYLFHEFLPLVDHTLRRRSAEKMARLLSRKCISCGECRRRLVGRLGELGIPLPPNSESEEQSRTEVS